MNMNSTGPPFATTAGCYSAVPMTSLQPAPMPTVPMIPLLQSAPMPAVAMMPLQPAPMPVATVPLQPPPTPTVPMMALQSAPMPAVATMPLQPAPTPTVPMMPLQSAPTTTVTLMPLRPAPTPTMPMMSLQAPAPFAVPVHEVWADNFHDVEVAIGYFAAHARCIAVDVHYPGVVHGAAKYHDDLAALTSEQRYATVKANVDALKPLQLGLAVLTDAGNIAAWEFNLSDFDPAVDPHAASSVSYLRGRGLRCDELRLRGIPVAKLTRALRLMCSRRPGVSWVTHTGAYHVAYLMKILSGGNKLPGDLAGFQAAVRRSLGEDVYDVATMASDCRDMPAGLEGIASRLGVAPPLSMHPLAGAGSVLALGAFMKLRVHVFRGNVTKYRGVLQGLQACLSPKGNHHAPILVSSH